VTVVIPAFNSAGTLADAVRSALDQDWPSLEVIVIDDGSTDGTDVLCEQLAADAGGRVRVLGQPNAGAGAARNTGIRAASHDYVAFLDADDAWVPTKLRQQMERLMRAPAGSVSFSAYTVERGGAAATVTLAAWDHDNRNAMLEKLLEGCCVATPTVVTSRAALLSAGGFDPQLRCCEDHDLWLRLLLNGCPFLYTAEPLTRVRMRHDSLSADEAEVARCADLMYQRLFSSGRLPADVQGRERFYMARCYLNSACRYLLSGDERSSLRSLGQALRTRPAAFRPGWLWIAIKAAFRSQRRREGRSLSERA
jgi:glycosyltransferase involved in cell wall biosynthesis